MQISSTLAATLRPSAAAAFALLSQLAQTLPARPVEKMAVSQSAVGTLTSQMIRAALLEMGLGAAEADVALAASLAQTGQPLTTASLTEAAVALAHAPGAAPEAYALAKSLSLPTSPATLKALTAVLTAPMNGLPTTGALPRGLQERMRQAQSSEDRVQGSLADTLASHLEGQQLLNQASLQAHADQPSAPLYLAVPLVFGGTSSLAEMRLWARTSVSDEAAHEDAEPSLLRVTVRVSPPRLGRVQADLSGRTTGSLSCRLGVEQVSAQRLLARHTGALAEALSEAGWGSCDVTCGPQSHWPPLWHGGNALTTPRTCVDRHV